MRGRPARGGRALLLALLLLHGGWRPVLAPAPAEDEGGGCTAGDEISRLRCQLSEARALIEDMAAQLARKQAQDKAHDVEDVLVKASKRSPSPSAQTVPKEQRKYPDQWRHSPVAKAMIGKDEHPDLRRHRRLSKYSAEKDTQRRLWGDAQDLPTIIAGLPDNVTVIRYPNQGLTGTVPPELGRFAQLEELDLSGNQLTGTVPTELGELVQLTELGLSDNQLTGTVPAELSRLAKLWYLSLARNQLKGTVPAELGKLAQLLDLRLEGNQLTGTLPPELSNLGQLSIMFLNDNQLTGTVPAELGKLGSLTQLVLSGNHLAGTIPPQLGNLTQLLTLGLHENKLAGTIPPELGNLTVLQNLHLFRNSLTGTLPAELGNLAAVMDFDVSDNLLTGTVPAEFANLVWLRTLDLGRNRLTGLADELGSLPWLSQLRLPGNAFSGTLTEAIAQLKALQVLNITDNPGFTGTFPDMTNSSVTKIYAWNCSFTSAGPMGDAVQTLSFANNKFTQLPEEWINLHGLLDLDVSNNLISVWRPHGVVSVEEDNGMITSLTGPIEPRFNWPIIQSLRVSGNPFGLSISPRDFIWSLPYLTSLSELFAAGCQLRGEVPTNWRGEFAPDVKMTDWGGVESVSGGYRGLLTLDLSDNNITAIIPPPPPRLSLADLHDNPIVHLNDKWYSALNNLDVYNNPLLRVDVAPPFRDSGCSSDGASTFEADPLGFFSAPGDAFQCTTLCPGLKTRYKHDASLNFSSLCRCTVGRQGAATNCTGCPADTYSQAEDKWAMVRTCRPCPERSSTEFVENASVVDQCKCQAGWYMETLVAGAGAAATKVCKRCKQGRFMDTVPGATQEAQCLCNASYAGLRALLGVCGCADGLYMDEVARECRPCDSLAEECTWGTAIALSLLPPVIKPSYWAATPPDVGPDEVSNFSKHDIWRCFSKETCPGNGTCAAGRSGTACSLCDEGMYGGPDGACKPCPYNPEDSRKNLLYGLLIGPAVTIAAHALLNFRDDSKGVAFRLGSVRTSGKQFLKYLQMLGVMAGFNIHWPPLAKEFFTEAARITVALPQVAGAACLTGQQTAALEMGFRWLLPVAGLLSACLSAVMLAPIRLFGRNSRFYTLLHMGYWDVLRVSLWGMALFYSTLLQFGTQVLACMPGPNGMSTVVSFPHLVCGGTGEWARLAAISCAFLLVFVGVVFLGIFAAWRHAMRTLVESNFESSGWWGFLFDDYRDGWGHWLLLTMAKDAALVVIATAGASDGPSQLLATAALATGYSYVVLRDQPFQDPSNSAVEAWTMVSVAVLSVFTAGVGFPNAPGVGDITELYRDGASDPEYKKRERALLAVQIITCVGMAAIMMYQLLCVSDQVRKRLPGFLRSPTEEEREKWNKNFFQSLKLDEATAADLWGVMGRLDVIDDAKFRDLMSTSTATLGIISNSATGLNIKSAVRKRTEYYKAASGSSGRLSASGSNLASQAPVAEAPNTMAPGQSNKEEEGGALPDGTDHGHNTNAQMALWAEQGDGKVVLL